MNPQTSSQLKKLLLCTALSTIPIIAITAEVTTIEMTAPGFTPLTIGDVAVDNNGAAVTTWTGSNTILVRLALETLNDIRPLIRIPTAFGNETRGRASVGMAYSGVWTISWVEYAHDLPIAVVARRFDRTGAALRDPTLVAKLHVPRHPLPSAEKIRNVDLAVVGDGRSVVVWDHDSDGDGESEVYAKQIDSSGNPIGKEIRVSAPTHRQNAYPRVAADKVGGFAVVWTGQIGDNDPAGIHVQRFLKDGTPLGKWLVASHGGAPADPDIAMSPDGRFVVVWDDLSRQNIWARPFNADGKPAGEQFAVVSGYKPAVAMAGDGTFVIIGAWGSSTEQWQCGGDLYRFPSRHVKSVTIDTSDCRARVAMDQSGKWVVAWLKDSKVKVRRYSGAY